jgi:hypothetical protein
MLGAAVIVTLKLFWGAETPRLSVSLTLKLADPGVVGVPLIAPVVEFSESPKGKDPSVTVQVKGVVPPVAVSVCE